MKFTAKPIIVLAFAAAAMLSCDINVKGIRGSGNVVSQTRNITEPFTAVKASGGIEVTVTQSATQSVVVEADDNLEPHIKTEVRAGVLNISSDYNSYHNVKSRKVIVNMTDVSRLESNSGVSMWSTGVIKTGNLNVLAKSGSEMKLNVEADNLDCESSSGSSLKIAGKAIDMSSSSSSGSTIDASGLMANDIRAEASSGSTITVHPLLSLTAEASSGSSIDYKGTPKKIKTDTSSGASISKI